mgnify:FL=1
MKTMLAAFAFTIAASFGAYFVLSEMGFSSEEVQSAPSVRLDRPRPCGIGDRRGRSPVSATSTEVKKTD